MAIVTLNQVETAIAGLVTNPETNYEVGDKRVDAGQKMTQLLALREQLMSNPAADISIMAFDALDIDELGINNTQEIL